VRQHRVPEGSRPPIRVHHEVERSLVLARGVPQYECGLSALYRATHSIVAVVTSITPFQAPPNSMISFLWRLLSDGNKSLIAAVRPGGRRRVAAFGMRHRPGDSRSRARPQGRARRRPTGTRSGRRRIRRSARRRRSIARRTRPRVGAPVRRSSAPGPGRGCTSSRSSPPTRP
jgi:hypothetical protein